MNRIPGNANVSAVVFATAIALLGGGAAHRWLDGFLASGDSTPVALERPLSSLPLQFGVWHGAEVPLNERILDVAGNDECVNRRYVNEESRQTVDFYLAYTLQPANMLGHRPQVCYPAHGWTHTGTKNLGVALPNGAELNCLIHGFARQQPVYQGLVVLNYYVLQGRHTHDWTDFWGLKWRISRPLRDIDFYVAQVQIGSTFMDSSSRRRAEEAVTRFAAEIAADVDSLLPGTQTHNAH